MKLHPALKQAQKILKKAGINTLRTGTLSLRVLHRDYYGRPIFIDIRPDRMEDNLARFSLSLFDTVLGTDHPMHSAIAFNNIEFKFP